VPSDLTADRVAAIAALAHLELAPSEIELFAKQLADILTYVEQLQQVDTTGVAPTATVLDHPETDRADEVRPCLDPDAAIANAPDANHAPALFRVPQVIG